MPPVAPVCRHTHDLTSYSSELMRTLSERGFLYQCTDSDVLDKKFREERVVAYLGFDATAPSLHVGSLVQIMMLRHLQRCGHKPVILVGGGTTKIGDPTGKDESRQLLTESTIRDNTASLAEVFRKYLYFGDGPTDAVIVNNSDWLDSLNYIEFLRDYGRHITVNRMLGFESVKQRLAREQPLSFLEFNYMLLQAYDFVKLHEERGVSLQLGGSDQWGNIVCGIELGRKTQNASLYGLTAPLITTSDGKKMGKTAGGAVWLDGNLLSAYDYWQFWRNTPDADVIRFLKLFTEVPMGRVQELEKMHGAQLNDAKVLLADQATTLLHGSECLEAIHKTASSLYSSGPNSSASLPSFTVQATDGAIFVIDALLASKLVSSRSDARRRISAGAVRVDGRKVVDQFAVIGDSSEPGVETHAVPSGAEVQLSCGKKKHVILNVKL